MKRKQMNILLSILTLSTITLGISNIATLVIFGPWEIVPDESRDNIVVFGTGGNIPYLDPAEAYDSASLDMIDQVCDTLYTFNLSAHPTYDLIPQLAVSLPNVAADGLSMEIQLRDKNITFHDGTKFDAHAVKWTLDRIMYFCNFSGNSYLPAPFNQPLLPSDKMCNYASLFELPDKSGIYAGCEVVDEYTINITLNAKKASFVNMLAYAGMSILSPASTPETTFMRTISNVLIGTGPFMYKYYTPGIECRLDANKNYWRGAPKIDSVIFAIIDDETTRMEALLSGEIDLLDSISPSYLSVFRNTEGIHFENGKGSTNTGYIGMNNDVFSKPLRQAISYAVDYNYIHQVVLKTEATRLRSPIPAGIPMSDYSFDVPTLDVLRARQILVDANYGGIAGGFDIHDEDDWEPGTLGTYNVTYNLETDVRKKYATIVSKNLEKIGIQSKAHGIKWGELLAIWFETGGHSKLEAPLYVAGWGKDYSDPENYISPLMGNTSIANSASINDPWLEMMMTAGEEETDYNTRIQIYADIQQYIVEDLMPWVLLFTGKGNVVWSEGLAGWPTNAVGDVDFYPVHWT